ncbi:MAG: globin family protein [Rhodospirillaceae bacterium]|jgi:hemoglobin-like flavoprotein
MTPQEIALVQDSFKKVLPIKETAAELFYNKLFEIDPSLKKLFKGDMKEQGRKLMAMIATAVGGLNKLDEIVPAVQDLGRRHKGYGVSDKDYDTVAQALLWTLGQGLGDGFTPPVKEAWTKCYMLLADTMKAAGRSELKTDVKPVKRPAKSWRTKMLKKSPAHTKLFEQMLETMPINVMLCDIQDFRITYVNQTSVDTLKTIEHVLPVAANEILGQCIDIFHKAP